jgi:hypothetical protein
MGVAIGSTLGNHDPKPTPFIKPTAAPTARITPAPTPVVGSGETPAPNTPTPNTPVPATAAPTSAPGDTGQSQLVDVANISVTIPGDWKIADKKDYLIDVRGAKGGQLLLASWTLKTPTTIDAYIQSVIDSTKKDSPDLTVCGGPSDLAIDNGPPGKDITLCYTATRTDGSKYEAVDDINAALGANGTILFQSEVYATKAVFNAFSDQAWKVVTPTTSWKLYKVP